MKENTRENKNIKETHIAIAFIDLVLLLGFSLGKKNLSYSNQGFALPYEFIFRGICSSWRTEEGEPKTFLSFHL